MIEIKNLSKEYHVTKKEEGIRGALKSLVKRDTITIPAVITASLWRTAT